MTFEDQTKKREVYKAKIPKKKTTFNLQNTKNPSSLVSAQFTGNLCGGVVTFPIKEFPKFSKFYIQLVQYFGPFEETKTLSLDAKPTKTSSQTIVTLIPCYNVAKYCEDVIVRSLSFSEKIILVDDGSTDETTKILKQLAEKHPDQIHLIIFQKNAGKGQALLEGFRYALSNLDFEVLVAIDSDSQHEPSEIPCLAQSIFDGEDFVIGARSFKLMPLKNRMANILISMLLKKLFPHAPNDTQSGLRAFKKDLLKEMIDVLPGGGYEMEFHCLLFALSKKKRVRSLPISTIYIDGNSSSHFSTFKDSLKIFKVLLHYAAKKKKEKKSSLR